PQTQAYTFDLPYLFLIRQEDSEGVYSLDPPRLADRDRYSGDVTNHWECKSVTADAVTYQFLICRTTTLPRNTAARSQSRPVFGASAYFILSDGKEASSSVKLTFNDANDTTHPVDDANGSNRSDGPGGNSLNLQAAAIWEVPDSDEKIVDLERDEFRIRC